MAGTLDSHKLTATSCIAHDIQMISDQALQLCFAFEEIPPLTTQDEMILEYPLRKFLSALQKFSLSLNDLADTVTVTLRAQEYEQIIAQQSNEIKYLQELLLHIPISSELLPMAMEG